MKKYFIAIAVAALALSACSKVEINEAEGPGKKITFQTANYVPQTKAGEVSVLNDFTAFNSMAYLHAQGVDLTQAGAENNPATFQNFFGAFPGETISQKTNSTEWDPSHTYYWPKGEKSYIDFIGWYGTSQPTIAYAMNGNSKWQATMTWDFTTTFGETGSNLMYADMAWRYKENTNPAQYTAVSGASEGVPMLFHHALAQINIKAYVAADNDTDTLDPVMTPDGAASIASGVTDGIATWTVKIKNAKIGEIYSAGQLKLTNVDPGTTATVQAWTGSWSGTGSAADVTIDDLTINQVTKAAANNLIAPSCVLPQSLSDVALDFDVEIVTTYDNPANPNTEVLHFNIPFSDMGSTEWAMNHKYTYYLRIVPSQNKVLFDPALDAAWVEVEGTEQIR